MQAEVKRHFIKYFFAAALGISAVFVLLFSLNFRHERERILLTDQTRLRTVANMLPQDMGEAVSDLRLLAESPELIRLLDGRESHRAAQVRLTELLLPFMRNKPDYYQVRYLNRDGWEMVRVNRRGDKVTVTAPEKLQLKRQRYYFRSIMALSPGEIYASPLDLNVEHGAIEIPFAPVIRIGTPVADSQGVVQGALIINIYAGELFNVLREEFADSPVSPMLLNADGYWLYDANPLRRWGFMRPHGQRFSERFPKAWAAISREEHGRYHGVSGEYVFTTVNPLPKGVSSDNVADGSSVSAGYPWSLVVFLPNEVLWQQALERHHWIVPMYLLLLLVAGAASYLFAQSRTAVLTARRQLAERSSALEQSGDMIMITDRNGCIEYVNASFEHTTRYRREEVIGRKPSLLRSGHHNAAFYREVWQRIRIGETVNYVFANRRKDGAIFYEDKKIAPLRDTHGHITHFIATGRDITERRAFEMAMEQKREFLDSILRGLHTGIVACAPDGLIVLCNHAASDLLGLPPLPPNPRRWGRYHTLYSADGQQPFSAGENPLRRILTGESVEEVSVVADVAGVRRHLVIGGQVITSKQGEVFGYLATVHDVTAQTEALRELGESEARFRAMTENVPGAVFRVQRTAPHCLAFSFLSSGARLVLERPAAQFLDNPDLFRECLVEQDRQEFCAGMDASERDGGVWNWEGRILSPEGRTKWINWRATPRHSVDGTITWDGVMVNITDAKQHEMELAEYRDRLRSFQTNFHRLQEEERAHIAREIHDELGSVLTGLKLATYWLTKRIKGEDEAAGQRLESMTGMINMAVEDVRRLASELRPRILDDFGIRAAIEWKAQDFEAQTGIPCDLSLGELPETLTPQVSTTLFRIFQEALTNIIRHAGATRVDVYFGQQGDDILLMVRDNGHGFSPREEGRFRSHGLFGMRERALSIGAVFQIEGAPGKGTIVEVRLPLQVMEKA